MAKKILIDKEIDIERLMKHTQQDFLRKAIVNFAENRLSSCFFAIGGIQSESLYVGRYRY